LLISKVRISSGDAFNRDMQLDLNTEYHVTRFRIDCRLADAFDNVDVAVTLLVGEGHVHNKLFFFKKGIQTLCSFSYLATLYLVPHFF